MQPAPAEQRTTFRHSSSSFQDLFDSQTHSRRQLFLLVFTSSAFFPLSLAILTPSPSKKFWSVKQKKFRDTFIRSSSTLAFLFRKRSVKHSPLRLSSNSYQPRKNPPPGCDVAMSTSFYLLTRYSIQRHRMLQKSRILKDKHIYSLFLHFHLLGQVSPRPTVSIEYKSVPESNTRLEKLCRQENFLHLEA